MSKLLTIYRRYFRKKPSTHKRTDSHQPAQSFFDFSGEQAFFSRKNSGSVINKKCDSCEKEDKKLHKREIVGSSKTASPDVSSKIKSLQGGSSLSNSTRSFFEPKFEADFSEVKIHNDNAAHQMASSVNAKAFTYKNNIVFNKGQYTVETEDGKKLLAHELAHIVQLNQSVSKKGNQEEEKIQRAGFGDVRISEGRDQLESEIRALPAFKALSDKALALTEEIFTMMHAKPIADQIHYYATLKILFETLEKTAAEVTTETNESTTIAVTAEESRITKPKEKKNISLEEKASKSKSRKWIAIKGKFGGGTYYVDSTSPTNIVVKVKVYLQPAGTGTADNVNDIKKMEDGIEKAASTKGYLVDIDFVNDKSDPDSFVVNVDPSQWEVATNWSGGSPVGYAHELHHLMAFELDRYNYFNHATNEAMKIPDRLYWFKQELLKPEGYNDPTSIMDSASHPNDSDVCTVAGLDPTTCLAERKKLSKP